MSRGGAARVLTVAAALAGFPSRGFGAGETPAGADTTTTSSSSHPAKPKVALVQLKLGASLERSRGALEATLRSGLADSGLETTGDSAGVLRGRDALARCRTDVCYRALSERLGAPYLVYADVVSTRTLYAVSLRLIDARDGRTLATTARECRATDPCPPVPKSVGELARELGHAGRTEIDLVERQQTVAPDGPGTTASPAPVRAPVSSVAPPVAIREAAAPPHVVAPSRGAWVRRAWPWAAIGAGGALLVTSAILFVRDGGELPCGSFSDGRVCRKSRETTAEAVLTGVGGLAAVGAGVTWLLLTRGRPGAFALTFGPGSAGLQGSF